MAFFPSLEKFSIGYLHILFLIFILSYFIAFGMVYMNYFKLAQNWQCELKVPVATTDYPTLSNVLYSNLIVHSLTLVLCGLVFGILYIGHRQTTNPLLSLFSGPKIILMFIALSLIFIMTVIGLVFTSIVKYLFRYNTFTCYDNDSRAQTRNSVLLAMDSFSLLMLFLFFVLMFLINKNIL